MPGLTMKTVLGAKIETTQGTAISLAATDMILVEGLQIDPIAERIERNYTRASLSPLTSLVGKKSVKVSFKTALKGSGAAGTAYAPLDALLQACGCTSTVSGGVSVTYARTSVGTANFMGPAKSVTLNGYYDTGAGQAIYFVVAGAVGNCKITTDAGGPAILQFDMQGIYLEPTDAAFPTATYLTQIETVVVTSTLTVLGLGAVAKKFEIDFGNKVSERVDTRSANGILGYFISDWRGKGSFDPELTTVAVHNFLNKLMTGAEGSASLVVGAVAGNITTITLPTVQYDSIKPADRSGARTLEIPFLINGGTGDADFTIAMT